MFTKDILGSHITLQPETYEKYVLDKGALLIRLEGIHPANEIEKSGGDLFLDGEKHDIRFLTVGAVIDLIHDTFPSVIISIENRAEFHVLDTLPALYLADFTSRCYRTFSLQKSYLPISRIQFHTDKLGSRFQMENYTVRKELSKMVKDSYTFLETVEIPDFEENLEIQVDYRAISLNIYMLHEIPMSSIGRAGIALFGEQ